KLLHLVRQIFAGTLADRVDGHAPSRLEAVSGKDVDGDAAACEGTGEAADELADDAAGILVAEQGEHRPGVAAPDLRTRGRRGQPVRGPSVPAVGARELRLLRLLPLGIAQGRGGPVSVFACCQHGSSFALSSLSRSVRGTAPRRI